MMLATDRFRDFIKEHHLFDASQKILLAVSGGRDSVLMAYLFNAAGYKFGIAHCNFGLRASEADEDEAFTGLLAKCLDVPFHHIRFETGKFASKNKLSVQMAARELRYSWFEEIRNGFSYDFVALAHHGGDVAETVLLNMVRGTGVSGLHGIFPKRGTLIRPLLFLTRPEIDRIIHDEKISFREDSSNSSSKYARNKIRHQVIPVLKELNPGLEQTFVNNSKRFADLELFLNAEVAKLRDRYFKKDGNSFIIEIGCLKNLNPLNFLLFELFKPFNFSEEVLSDLINSWDSFAGKLFRSPSHVINLDRSVLILSEKESAPVPEKIILETDTKFGWNDLLIMQTALSVSDTEIKKDSGWAYFDADKLIYPLRIRHWEKGDHFKPLGMKGQKKLSDYFISQKIPRQKKMQVPVLVNGNNDILWVVGYRTDDRYKVSPRSKKIIIFELLNDHGK